MYRIAKCNVIWTNCDGISNNTSQILWYKLFFQHNNKHIWNVRSYSQTFPEIMFIFPTKKYQGFRPDWVCFRMSKPCQGYDVDATVNACTGFTYVHAIHPIFQQSVRIFTTMPKVLCACNIFLLMNELQVNPEMENMQVQPPSFL